MLLSTICVLVNSILRVPSPFSKARKRRSRFYHLVVHVSLNSVEEPSISMVSISQGRS
jgi:hypothetical protein